MAVGDFYTYTGTLSSANVTVLTPGGSTKFLVLSGAGGYGSFTWGVGAAALVQDPALRGLVVTSGAALSFRRNAGSTSQSYAISLIQVE